MQIPNPQTTNRNLIYTNPLHLAPLAVYTCMQTGVVSGSGSQMNRSICMKLQNTLQYHTQANRALKANPEPDSISSSISYTFCHHYHRLFHRSHCHHNRSVYDLVCCRHCRHRQNACRPLH
ncbi:uncharacterized protein BDR25DRAFT_49085 [Lindgomyces ingoldianus]|uniref:Uncharacterized protein n=1 Tax=Lindgomyces ingoldianus TaxID=673940 RepID=A0ACB6QSX9_9PLEO|nr:uncharacterized protein BDR25DRAFT_49085 [Lindgomyces ingoldianus]KAF2469407.1 hypothetical protein BDR25DRAFT_49085 [Lindgomyces ingoldianus]